MTQFTAGRRDYKFLDLTARQHRPRVRRWLWLVGGLTLLAGILSLLPDRAATPARPTLPHPAVLATDNILPASRTGTIQRALPLPPAGDTVTSGSSKIQTSEHQQALAWRSLRVKPGDSLARLFQRAGIRPAQVLAVINSGQAAKRLTQLHPGDMLRYQVDEQQHIVRLSYTLDESRDLDIQRQAGRLTAKLNVHDLEIRHQLTSGRIRHSLYTAARNAGLSDNLIMELAGIFGWDIDFALDIRQGDQFTVLYQSRYRNGEEIGDGDILAAEFINHGKRYRAVRYRDGNYYSPKGRSMRKAFLRSPVDFRRISSRFRKARWHPLLGKKRPHRGVDYAAATGTPIKAAGDGKIIFRGTKGGYGRTVIIQHGTRYSTLYAHMSSYRRGQRRGSRVAQGETIGYVGKSGLATGPHLHYEFRVNGVHRNPLTVKLPQAQSISKKYRDDFRQRTAPLLARLDTYQRALLALNNTSTTP